MIINVTTQNPTGLKNICYIRSVLPQHYRSCDRISLDSFGTVASVTHMDDYNQLEDVTEESEQENEDRLDATNCQSGLHVATICDHKWYNRSITK